MKTTVAALAAGLAVGGWLWRRRSADSETAGAVADRHIADDPRTILRSEDPDDVVSVLESSWSALTTMAAEVEDLPTDGKALSERARHAMQRLVITAVQLDAAEDSVLWPEVRTAVEGGAGLADEADSKSLELRRLLQSLDHQRPDDPHWTDELDAVRQAVYGREGWSRTAVWPAVSRQIEPARRAELGRQLLAARESAPTRPHLPTPGQHPHVDGALARLDRVGDKVTGRG